MKDAAEVFIATLLLTNSGAQFAELRKDVNNDHVRGKERSYPRTSIAVQNLLLHYKCDAKPAAGATEESLVIAQQTGGVGTPADKSNQDGSGGGSGGSIPKM